MSLYTLANDVRVLISDRQDIWYTNGESYAQLVYLGKEANIDEWKQISDDEYKRLTGIDSIQES